MHWVSAAAAAAAAAGDGADAASSEEVGSTDVLPKTLNPRFSDEVFELSLRGGAGSSSHADGDGGKLRVEVFDHDLLGKHAFLGEAVVSQDEILSHVMAGTASTEHSFPLRQQAGRKGKVRGTIELSFHFVHDRSPEAVAASVYDLDAGPIPPEYRLSSRGLPEQRTSHDLPPTRDESAPDRSEKLSLERTQTPAEAMVDAMAEMAAQAAAETVAGDVHDAAAELHELTHGAGGERPDTAELEHEVMMELAGDRPPTSHLHAEVHAEVMAELRSPSKPPQPPLDAKGDDGWGPSPSAGSGGGGGMFTQSLDGAPPESASESDDDAHASCSNNDSVENKDDVPPFFSAPPPSALVSNSLPLPPPRSPPPGALCKEELVWKCKHMAKTSTPQTVCLDMLVLHSPQLWQCAFDAFPTDHEGYATLDEWMLFCTESGGALDNARARCMVPGITLGVVSAAGLKSADMFGKVRTCAYHGSVHSPLLHTKIAPYLPFTPRRR